jgi:hypothetical protein
MLANFPYRSHFDALRTTFRPPIAGRVALVVNGLIRPDLNEDHELAGGLGDRRFAIGPIRTGPEWLRAFVGLALDLPRNANLGE